MSKPKVVVTCEPPGPALSRAFEQCDVWMWEQNRPLPRDLLLEKIAERLKAKYGMEMVHLDTKQSASHGIKETAVKEFKTKADFVIAGIGD